MRVTAAQLIILAADKLRAGGHEEFTEWQLTMQVWIDNKAKFGLRGYETQHPDHKRVSSEIMGSKSNSPVMLGYLVKVRPNTYSVTQIGRLAAERLRVGIKPTDMNGSTHHARLSPFVTHAVFQGWKADPELPRHWSSVGPFLALAPVEPRTIAQQMNYLRSTIAAAIADLRDRGQFVLQPPTSRRNDDPISATDISDLNDFLHMLTYRFPEELPNGTAERPSRSARSRAG